MFLSFFQIRKQLIQIPIFWLSSSSTTRTPASASFSVTSCAYSSVFSDTGSTLTCVGASQVDRVPYMLVLGAKEAEAGNISVRDRKGETTEMSLEDFIAKVTTEIRTRSL